MTISTNNFNCNSNGPNIEFVGYFDCHQSQQDFNDNFERILQGGHRGTDIHFYNPSDQLKQDFSLLIKASKKDLHRLALEYRSDFASMQWPKSELLEIVMEFIQDELAAYKYDVAELSAQYKIDISFVNDIEIVETKGYSQGDFALVIVDKTQLIKLWGNYVDDSERKNIDHFFWDAPVYSEIRIDDSEYSYFDYDLKPYKWERDEFISLVAKAAKIELSALESLVPKDLDHMH